jgi:hypothetical protein
VHEFLRSRPQLQHLTAEHTTVQTEAAQPQQQAKDEAAAAEAAGGPDAALLDAPAAAPPEAPSAAAAASGGSGTEQRIRILPKSAAGVWGEASWMRCMMRWRPLLQPPPPFPGGQCPMLTRPSLLEARVAPHRPLQQLLPPTAGVQGRGQKRSRDGGQQQQQQQPPGGRWARSDGWEGGRHRYLKFVLYKENMDTQAAVSLLGHMLHCRPGTFGFAGAQRQLAPAAADCQRQPWALCPRPRWLQLALVHNQAPRTSLGPVAEARARPSQPQPPAYPRPLSFHRPRRPLQAPRTSAA